MKLKYRKGVFVVIYRKEKEKLYYLLLKRKHHWKGWEFPKGGAEKNESLLETAKREAKEETGQRIFNIKKYNSFGRYKYKKKFSDRPGLMGQTYTLFSGQTKDKKIKFDKKEHLGYKWLEFDKAVNKLTHNNQRKSLKIVNKNLK
ncbi:MAG: NUDIX domain-containing protein [Candidatus Pacearchaeota archaeon]